MRTAYFSFGQTHSHSVNGFTYDKDVLVKIAAVNPRARMFQVFGAKWAMEYDEPIDTIYYPRGIKVLES